MNFDLAKLKLLKAETVFERQQAIRSALDYGMTLHEVERYLDWVDFERGIGKQTDAHLKELDQESVDDESNDDD